MYVRLQYMIKQEKNQSTPGLLYFDRSITLIKDNWNNFRKDADSQWQRLMRYLRGKIRSQFHPRSFQKGRNFTQAKFINTKARLIFHLLVTNIEQKCIEFPILTVQWIQSLELQYYKVSCMTLTGYQSSIPHTDQYFTWIKFSMQC